VDLGSLRSGGEGESTRERASVVAQKQANGTVTYTKSIAHLEHFGNGNGTSGKDEGKHSTNETLV
jgi:hypothetical protein